MSITHRISFAKYQQYIQKNLSLIFNHIILVHNNLLTDIFDEPL